MTIQSLDPKKEYSLEASRKVVYLENVGDWALLHYCPCAYHTDWECEALLTYAEALEIVNE